MPMMTIRVTNATFESSNAAEFESVDEAFAASLTAGLEIAATEIRAGAASTIVEVVVDLPGQRAAARGAVAVSTARFVDSYPRWRRRPRMSSARRLGAVAPWCQPLS